MKQPQSPTSQSSTTSSTTPLINNKNKKNNNTLRLFLSYIQVETYTTVLSFRTNADTIFGKRTVSFPYPALRATRTNNNNNNNNNTQSSSNTAKDNDNEESTENTVGFTLTTKTTPTPQQTKRALSKSNVVVVFLSQSYLSRRTTLYELGWAMEYQKRVVVIDCRSSEKGGGGLPLVLPSITSEGEDDEEEEEKEGEEDTSNPTLENVPPPSIPSVTTIPKTERIFAPCEFRWIYHPKHRLRYTENGIIPNEETEEVEEEGGYGGVFPPQLPTNTTVHTLVFQALKKYEALVRNHGTDWYLGDGVVVVEDGDSKHGNGTKDPDGEGEQQEMEKGNGHHMFRTVRKAGLGWRTRVCGGSTTMPYLLVYWGVAAVGGLVLAVYFLFVRKE